jgi:DNA-binding CsgD family transcriptional regulator
LSRTSLREAYRLATVGTGSEIFAAARSVSATDPAGSLLRALQAQYEGDVDGAIERLRRLMRRVAGVDRAMVADVLAPLLVMRHVPAEVARCADALQAAGWRAGADAFRALAAFDAGNRRVARRRAARARALLDDETDPVMRARVMQRVARLAFLFNDYADAVDLATACAKLSVAAGAWRTAAASYSIVNAVHHGVTGDLVEADRYASLSRAAAAKAEDLSFEHLQLLTEYGLAVEFGDVDRVAGIEKLIASRALPQLYVERFPHALAYAIVRGWTDLRAMQTLLEVLASIPGTPESRVALCTALIALSAAAHSEDDEARQGIRLTLRMLGRASEGGPAYERRYRRLARVCAAAACLLIGDDVRATRLLAVREAQHGDGEMTLPGLMRAGRLAEAAHGMQGLARVFARAAEMRRLNAVPADLTPAQFEVLQLLGRGWSAHRIATETGRTRNTVYNHTRAILAKFDARRAGEAVAIARERGILL